jgi:hypothetical protein
MIVIVSLFDTAVRVLFTLQYYFFVCPSQFSKMPTRNPPTGTDGTEDGLSQHVKHKLQRVRFSTTTSKDRPKRHATKPDKRNVAPLLAEYASATTSKTAVSLRPISLRDNNTKRSTDPSDDDVNKKPCRAWKKSRREPRSWGLHLLTP